MMDERNCATCAHRWGLFKKFWQCTAVGMYCSTEAKFGGRCRQGDTFVLWERADRSCGASPAFTSARKEGSAS